MGRKLLQDVANTLPQMFVGWRMAEDLEILAELPDGTLEIDVLSETVRHSSGATPRLHVAGELAAWLRNRLDEARLALTELTKAHLVVVIRTERIVKTRKRLISFDFACTCTVTGYDRTYVGHLIETHKWNY
jgi:hypothetical protein